MKLGLCVISSLLAAAVANSQTLDEKRSAAEAKEIRLLDAHVVLQLLQPGSTCDVEGTIAYGQTVNGSLSTTDCQVPSDNSYVDFWGFQGTAGDSVTIDLSSPEFDTYLVLETPSLARAATNDDFGSGTDSRITFTLTATGTWVIGANSLFGNKTGAYTLALAHAGGGPPPSACSSATSLCLGASRFTVTVAWNTTDGRSGQGQAIPLSDDTGYFWFFNSANVELVVKVLDGRAFGGHFWVFYGALSDVHYVITVTDTTNGAHRTYTGEQGHQASGSDTSAF